MSVPIEKANFDTLKDAQDEDSPLNADLFKVSVLEIVRLLRKIAGE